MHGMEENAEQEREGETQIHDTWEGLGDAEELGGEEALNAMTSKADKAKKKKKRKRKRKSKDVAEDLEVETPQLGDDNSLGEISLPDVVGKSATIGHFEGPSAIKELMVEDPPAAKHLEKVNGAAPKRKRAPKSKAVLPEDDARAEDKEGDETAVLVNATSKPRKTVKRVKPRKSHQALEPDPDPEPETLDDETEALLQDIPISDLSELPQRIMKAKKSQRTLDVSAEKLQEDDNDSATMLHQPPTPAALPPTYIKSDTQEANLAASSQLQRDARSIASPEPVNSEDTEQVEPRQPSKKALGKRKAVDEPVSRVPNKKTKRGKDKAPQGRDLRAMGFLPSDQSSTSLAEIATKLWEETNCPSPEPAPSSNSQSSLRTPRPSWNAVNNPVEPDGIDESDRSLFVPDQEEPSSPEFERTATKSNGPKICLPVDEPGPSNSTPVTKSRLTPAKSKAKTPKTPGIKENGVRATPFSKGKLSADKVDAISSAVESYRELCNITQFQMNELIQSDAQQKVTQEMWKAICDEVGSGIPRRSVQNTCRRKFHNFEARGAWTEEQDNELRRSYDEHPGKWKLIGETLNRFPEDVRDRWRNYLVCGDTLKKDAWDIQEEEYLRAAVKKCIRAAREKNSLSEDQATPLNEESLIDWQKVSELMGRTRSRLQCRNKWKKLKDREESCVDDPVAKLPISESWRLEEAALQARLFSAEEKLVLLRAIRDSGAAREGKIPWQTIKDDLNGQGKRMAWKYCFRKLKDRISGHRDMDFKNIVAHLVDVFETAAPDEPDGFDLPIEVFPKYENPNTKKTISGSRRVKRDNGEGPGTPKKRETRGRKQDQPQNSDGEPRKAPTVRSRKLRDRMLKEGESQETANSQGESANIDIGEDVVQSFQSIKRTPKATGKRVIRKSKRNQALSEEKVIEDPSDDEKLLMNGVNWNAMDIDHEENYNTTGGPVADDEVDDEASNEQQDDPEDFDLSGEHTNSYHVEGSPDLDTPVRGRTFKKLGSPIFPNGNSGEDFDTGAISSDDDDMSDIPARRLPREESLEL